MGFPGKRAVGYPGAGRGGIMGNLAGGAAEPATSSGEIGRKAVGGVKKFASALGVGAGKTTPPWGLNVIFGDRGSWIPLSPIGLLSFTNKN
jgi:hypothetical protein